MNPAINTNLDGATDYEERLEIGQIVNRQTAYERLMAFRAEKARQLYCDFIRDCQQVELKLI